jgi:hypothetical protein
VSPQILAQIAVAEDMILEAMAPLGQDMTKLKEALALLGVGKMVRWGWDFLLSFFLSPLL